MRVAEVGLVVQLPHPKAGTSPPCALQAYERESIKDVMVHHAKDLVDQNNMQEQRARAKGEMGNHQEPLSPLLHPPPNLSPDNPQAARQPPKKLLNAPKP